MVRDNREVEIPVQRTLGRIPESVPHAWVDLWEVESSTVVEAAEAARRYEEVEQGEWTSEAEKNVPLAHSETE